MDPSNEFQVFSNVCHEDLEEMCRIQEKSRWTSEDISLGEDTKNWKKLDEKTQHFVKYVLSFSVVSEHLVNCNLLGRFLGEVTDPSVKRFYLFQAYMEDVHRRTYGLMLSSILIDPAEMAILARPVSIPSINEKIKWIQYWTGSDASFEQRLVAFALIEGIFFSSLFCSFYWLKQRGVTLPGMIKANEYISRDEKLHCEFAIKQLHHRANRLPRETIWTMMRDAVDIERKFVDEALPIDLIGINKNTMVEYVRYIADRWLCSIPCIEGMAGPFYGVTQQPLEWMEAISIQSFASFFEVDSTNYVDSRLGYSLGDRSFETSLDVFVS